MTLLAGGGTFVDATEYVTPLYQSSIKMYVRKTVKEYTMECRIESASAMLTGIAIGVFSDLEYAASIMVKEAGTFYPRSDMHEKYMNVYQRYAMVFPLLMCRGISLVAAMGLTSFHKNQEPPGGSSHINFTTYQMGTLMIWLSMR